MCPVSYSVMMMMMMMRSPNILSLLFITSLLLLHDVIVFGKPSCPAGHFRNQTTASPLVHCSPCSTCAINHIVRKPCNRQNDTVCGPFYEFEFFNQRQQRPNQASEGLGWKRPMMKGDTEAEEDGGGGGADGKYGGHHLFYGQQTTNSPDEEASSTLRCGHAAEWRVLCYGLVAAVVIVISVALSAVALFSYCRANVKTLRISAETSRATSTIVTDADAPSSAADHPASSSAVASSSTTTTIVVDRSVRHLEEQLFHNERRRAFLRWLFGSSDAAATDRLFSSNDYLEERHRRRFLLLLQPSTADGRGRPTDSLPLQPYPGMISTGPRTDHDRSYHPFTDAAAAGGGGAEDAGSGNRMDRMPRLDEGIQADEQATNHGERSRLITPEQ